MVHLLHGVNGWLTLIAAAAVAVFGWVGAPDAGAGGGAGDNVDAGGGDDGAAGGDDGDAGADDDAGGDAGDDDTRRAGSGDDDFDDDDDQADDAIDATLPDEVKNHPRYKQLRTWNRRNQRRLSALRPIVEHFRSRNSRLSSTEISRLLNRAQDMEELDPLLAQHPDLVQTILERKAGKGRPAAADADEAFVDPFADETKVPFDTSTESGRVLLTLFRENAKTAHDQKQAIRRLERQLGTVAERDTTRTIGEVEGRWKTATISAIKDLPREAQEAIVLAVQSQFDLAKERRQLGRIDPRQIIERAVAPFKRALKGQQRRTVAGQQQRAADNTKLPRSQGQGRTAAASPNDANKGAGTIKDGRKAFFARIGQSAPPGR